MKLTFSIFALLLLNKAYPASGGVGNGGDVIVCPEEVILLDSYEAQKMRLNIDLSNVNIQNPSWRTMINVAVKRLQRVDEVTATKLYDYSMEMVNDFEKFQMYPEARGQAVYIGHDIIAEINDSEHVSTPEGCEEHPRQLVSQREPKFRNEFRYEFNKTLWDKMSLLQQSMTILHEAWYRIMIENDAETSRAARYMNALVASREFESYTFAEYFEDLRNTEIEYYMIPNKSDAIKTETIMFNLREHVLNIEDDMVCAPNFKLAPSIKQTYTLFNRRQRYLGVTKFQNVCVKNSRIRKLVLPTSIVDRKRTLRLPFHQVLFESSLSDSPAMIFNKDGKLTNMTGIQFGSVMEMYYICNGEVSYKNNTNCEEGPFINHDTKIDNPLAIIFDSNERPLVFRR